MATETNAPVQLAASTLLEDETGDVFSTRHRVLEAVRSLNDGDVPSATRRIQGWIESGALKVCDDPSKASIPTCVHCGCDEQLGCDGGCSWAYPGVCSRCYEFAREPRSRADIERDANGCNSVAAERLQIEVLLDIRRAAFDQVEMTRGLATAMGVMLDELSENIEKAVTMARLRP